MTVNRGEDSEIFGIVIRIIVITGKNNKWGRSRKRV